jgi:HPt (histidine-containing phosphotransfer) domain-containing protein
VDTAKLNAVLERWIPKDKQIRLSGEEAAAARSATAVNNRIAVEIIIGGVDTARGLSTVRGDAENYMRVLSVFYKDGQEKIAEINKALGIGDMRLYTTYVHALKSAAANIGAVQLSEIALTLETAGKEGNRACIDEYTPRLIYELKLLLLNIGNFLRTTADKSQVNATVDTDALKRTLGKLKEAVSTVAIGEMRAAMKELQPYASSNNPTAPQIDSILQCVLGGRYDEAVGLIEAVIGILG